MSNEKTINQVTGTEQEAVKADIILAGDVNELLPSLLGSNGLAVGNIAELPGKDKVELLKKLTAYTSQKSDLIDTYLGKTLYLVGAFISPAQVRLEKPKIDEITGELVEYQKTERTVMKFYLDEKEAKARKTEPITVGFSSISAASWFKNYIFPAFGLGDFNFEIPIEVQAGTCKNGRVYNFRVV